MAAVAKELNHIAGNVMHQIQMVLMIHLKTHSGEKSNTNVIHQIQMVLQG